jgi:hypothetical protein
MLDYGSSLPRKLATILALALAVPALAAASQAGSTQVPGQTPADKSDLFSQQTDRLGANSCARLYSALGRGAVAGSNFTVRTEADRGAPNAHAVNGTAVMIYNLPAVKGPAAALVAVTPIGDRCEGQFVRIVPFQVSCSQVLRDFPAGTKPIGDLSGVPLYQLGGGGGQALTIPSGQTCIVVSIVQGQQTL